MRTLRQSMLYRDRLSEVVGDESVNRMVLNNLLRQKLLPRFSFDGSQKPRGRAEADCISVVEAFRTEIDIWNVAHKGIFSAGKELDELIARAKANHNVFNYWA